MKATVPAPASGSLGARVVKATLAIAIAHLMVKVLSLIQTRVVGHFYGLRETTDAFVFVSESLIGTVFLIGEETIAPGYLPIFRAAKDEESEERAWRFTSTILNLQILLLTVVVALLMIFPDTAVAWLSRFQTNGKDSTRSALAVTFLRAMAPAVWGLSIGSLTYVVLNGYKRFFWAAVADVMLKGVLVFFILFGQIINVFSN